MKRIYLYPKIDKNTLVSPNPYIDHLENALKKEFRVVNTKANTIGVVDFFKFIFKTDIYFFNWIEYLPKQKMGKIQTLAFLLFLFISRKLLYKKIVWVLHNKYSHTKLAHADGVSFWKRFIFELMIKKSDLIITHSSSGIDFVKEKFPKYARKVKYFVHPTDELFPFSENNEIKFDLMIWGTIHPYKGITDFLKFIKENKSKENIRLVILGKCPDKKLKAEINGYLNENIIHRDDFLNFDEIARFANQSKYVLFTYNSESVLSSGALMDSIRMGSNIIGPQIGAFLDLNEYSFINTYGVYEDIFTLLNNKTLDKNNTYSEIKEFCNDNDWKKFHHKISTAFRDFK